jgi:hypothetical protein
MVVDLAFEAEAGGLEFGGCGEVGRQEDRPVAKRADEMLDDSNVELVRVESGGRRAQAAYPR